MTEVETERGRIDMRPLTCADQLSFVLSAWLKSYRDAPAVRVAANADYFQGQKHLILEILEKAVVTLACDPEAPDVIWGFICYDGRKLHYIYVKHALRKAGIARALWEHAKKPITATHLSLTGETILRKKKESEIKIHYNPYAIWERD